MFINAGWANNCGKELFTLGWVECNRAYDTYGIFAAYEQSQAILFQGWYNGLTQVSERDWSFSVDGFIDAIYAPEREVDAVRKSRRAKVSINNRLGRGRKKLR